MNNKERARHRQNHIKQRKISDLSGAQFCNQHGLDLAKFYYWNNKVLHSSSKAVSDPNRAAGFATVVVTDSLFIGNALTLHTQWLRHCWH